MFCDFFEAKSVLIAVWLATGTFVTEDRGDLRMRFLVLSVLKWCDSQRPDPQDSLSIN